MSKVRSDNISNRADDGAPALVYGAEVPVGYGITGAGGINITGVATAASFSGNVTGNVTGNITGTTGTFTGNVSVGGTLTYDDVTNVDSVGIITARSGIKIGAGQSVSAVSGITTYYGDGSQLTGINNDGINFVASGDIGNGQTVVINTDGTVGIVTLSTSNTPSVGTPSVFASASTEVPSAAYDTTNNKLVIAYRDAANSNYGTAIVGTVSGTSISFGTAVVFESAAITIPHVAFDSSNNKVVTSCIDGGNSSKGTASVGTVSGTSISFGTPVVFGPANTEQPTSTYDSDNNKVIFAYRDASNSDYGTAVNFSVTSQTTNLTAENYIGIAAEAIADGATGKINVLTGTNTGQTGLTTAQKYFVQTNGTLATSAGDPSVVAGTAISSTKIVVR